jgi:dTDP-4-dehydrorhamnose reductase
LRLPYEIAGIRAQMETIVAFEKPVGVMVLGASGMLGNTTMRVFASDPRYSVLGSIRSATSRVRFPEDIRNRLIDGIEAENADALTGLLAEARPDVVINCIGVIKQLSAANDPLAAIPINSVLPHRLARLCRLINARLVHIGTDCVFDGSRGNYKEIDRPDAQDLYGRTKLLGEVDYPHAVTLRTSIIGRELGSTHGLIDWFLSQEGSVKGYSKAVFSGVPTVELARIIKDFVLPRPELHGLYHVSADPIDKYKLLRLVSEIYGKRIEIVPDDSIVINRSLDSTVFRQLTRYTPPSWRELITSMHDFG